MSLQPEKTCSFFCDVAANHNAEIGIGVVDQLWRHCLGLLLFSRVSVNYIIKAIY